MKLTPEQIECLIEILPGGAILRKKRCLWCSRQYLTKYAHAKYCRLECTDAAANQRHNEKRRQARDPQGYQLALVREASAKELTMKGISEAFGNAFSSLEVAP